MQNSVLYYLRYSCVTKPFTSECIIPDPYITSYSISLKSSLLSLVQKYYHTYKENGTNNDQRKKYLTYAEFKHSDMVTA